jgi:hypothetical protein
VFSGLWARACERHLTIAVFEPDSFEGALISNLAHHAGEGESEAANIDL